MKKNIIIFIVIVAMLLTKLVYSKTNEKNPQELLEETKRYLIEKGFLEEVILFNKYPCEITDKSKITDFAGKVSLKVNGNLEIKISNYLDEFIHTSIENRAAILIHEIDHIKYYNEKKATGSVKNAFRYKFIDKKEEDWKKETRAYLAQIDCLKKLRVQYQGNEETESSEQVYNNTAIMETNMEAVTYGKINVDQIYISGSVQDYYKSLTKLEIPYLKSSIELLDVVLQDYDSSSSFSKFFKKNFSAEIATQIKNREDLKKKLEGLTVIKKKLEQILETNPPQPPVDPPTPPDDYQQVSSSLENVYGLYKEMHRIYNVDGIWTDAETPEYYSEQTEDCFGYMAYKYLGRKSDGTYSFPANSNLTENQKKMISDYCDYVLSKVKESEEVDIDTPAKFFGRAVSRAGRISEDRKPVVAKKVEAVKAPAAPKKVVMAEVSKSLQEQMSVAYKKYMGLVSEGKGNSPEGLKAFSEYRRLKAEVDRKSGAR